MAEEQEESTGKSFKGIIITLVSTVTLGVGGFITNKLTGGGDDQGTATQTTQPVINITNSNQQAAPGKTVVIQGGGGTPATAKPAAPAPAPKKKEADEFKEKPAQW